jgi:hypothetical protein
MSALADFSARQNSPESLERLRASSHYYGIAKTILGWQFGLSVLGALATSVLVAVVPDAKIWGVLYSILVALADALWLDPWQGRLRTLGAKVQETFDAGLFGFPWRRLQAGARPGPEELIAAARRFDGNEDHLKDWYPPAAGRVPRPFDTLICQRINVWWDAELRRKVGFRIIAVLVVSVVAVVVIGVVARQTTEQLVLTTLAPLLPVLLWCVRESRRQFDAAKKLESIKDAITAAWAEAQQNPEGADLRAVEIQSAIFDHRSRHPLIFNWVHRLFRPEGQETMTQMADRLEVELAERRGNHCARRARDDASGGAMDSP